MQVGAVLTISEVNENEGEVPALARLSEGNARLFTRNGGLTVLGHNLRERTNDKLHQLGVNRPTVVRSYPVAANSSLTANHSDPAWERAITKWLKQGVSVLFLLREGAYSDLDFQELLRFHLERKADLTQVYAADGCLDVALVKTDGLRNTAGISATIATRLRLLIPQHERFFYRGYVNRLRKPADFVRLIEDGLHGRCALRPLGTEIASGVWFGEGADADPSCVIGAPCFVGEGTRVASACRISRDSSIERGCEIDAGTTIEHSWILPATYVGVGLNVRHAIVSNNSMFHLDRNTQITITDRRLIGATHSPSWFGIGGVANRPALAEGPTINRT